MKSFKILFIALFIGWLLAVGTLVHYGVKFWNDAQMSQRIETFADKNFPVKK